MKKMGLSEVVSASGMSHLFAAVPGHGADQKVLCKLRSFKSRYPFTEVPAYHCNCIHTFPSYVSITADLMSRCQAASLNAFIKDSGKQLTCRACQSCA